MSDWLGVKAGVWIIESSRRIQVAFEQQEGELVPQGARMLGSGVLKTGGPEQAFLGELMGPPGPRVPRCPTSTPAENWWALPSAAR